MTAMPHLSDIEWDYADRMQHTILIGGGDVYFTYDATGQRVRNVHVHSGRVDERATSAPSQRLRLARTMVAGATRGSWYLEWLETD